MMAGFYQRPGMEQCHPSLSGWSAGVAAYESSGQVTSLLLPYRNTTLSIVQLLYY